MPTATDHIRSRGYDHAVLIARAVARELRAPFTKALFRPDRSEVFGVRLPGSVVGRHVLLVDDVVVTGASIEEAAHALMAAGAKSVDVLAFAQV